MASAARGSGEAGQSACRVRIDWLPIAERDRDSQLTYVAERNPSAAISMGDSIEAATRGLGTHPNIGRLGRIVGTRELVVSGTPYVIAYRVEADNVVILRPLHGMQRWPATF